MWWSPGIVVGGVIVLVAYHIRGTAADWWVWLVAIIAAILVDAACGVERKREIKHKTRTVYRKDTK